MEFFLLPKTLDEQNLKSTFKTVFGNLTPATLAGKCTKNAAIAIMHNFTDYDC